MLTKIIKITILTFWLVMLGLLVERTYLRPASVIALDVITEEGVRTGDEWFGIFQKGRKIGYAHTRITPEADTYHIIEESELDILALGTVQRIKTVLNSYATRNFLLKYFDFTLKSTMTSMEIKGAVVGKKLVLDIISGNDQPRKEHMILKEPPYLSPNIKPAIVLLGLEQGRKYSFPLFNPATMSTEYATVTVESREKIKVGDQEQLVYKLKETFQGMDAYAWVTQDGETIKEESPLGYVLLKETMQEALKPSKEGPIVDIVSLTMIPSSPITNSSQVKHLSARLSNVDLDGFQLEGDRQHYKDGTIIIDVDASAATYRIPYPENEHADDLKPTSLIQSDDKRIRDQATRIVKQETNASEAARKLNSWVYESIQKKSVVSIPSAIEVLNNRVGDCNEHTTLYTALARSIGIPTRMAAGIVYMRDGFYYHAWPEVWLGRWTAIDPTFNQFPADATHIRFMTGDLGSQTSIMKLVGKLKVEVLEYK